MHCPSAPPEVVAHRGASAYAAEHTFAAYDLALAQGADALELDVRATEAGELVVLHDATLARTAGDPRAVAALVAGEIARLDPAVRPLTLAAVLDRYAGETRWLVELKDPEPRWEGAVAGALAARGLWHSSVVQSFDLGALRRLRRLVPALAVAPLYRRTPGARGLRAIAGFASGIGVRHDAVTPALAMAARSHGLAVRAWTPNTPAEVLRLLAIGVDGVITDMPDVARGLVDRDAATPLAA